MVNKWENIRLYFLISVIDPKLFKAIMIILHCPVYNIHKCNVYDDNSMKEKDQKWSYNGAKLIYITELK